MGLDVQYTWWTMHGGDGIMGVYPWICKVQTYEDRCPFSHFAAPIIDSILYPDLHHTWSGRLSDAVRLTADPPFLCWLLVFALIECPRSRTVSETALCNSQNRDGGTEIPDR